MRSRVIVTFFLAATVPACAQIEEAARDVDSAVADLFAATPQTNAERHYQQGLRYANGTGVPVDPAKAVAEFRQAAAEIPDAAFLIGLAYRTGRGVARDDGAAVTWFRQAADKGHADAQFMLGLASLRGLGVAREPALARDWFAKAAAQGHAGAQYHLGLDYAAGAGGPRDDALAVSWLDKAAAQNHPEAQFALAEAYMNGRGAEIDDAWAARWYGKAADQGVVRAQYMLGVAYATGLGLPKSLPEAAKWLTLAAAKGDSDAVRLRDAVAGRITPAERDAANAFSQHWRPRAPGAFADPPTVRFVQYALSRLGFEPGEADGVWGARSARAAAAYRQQAALPGGSDLTPDLVQRLKNERRRRGG